MNFNLRNNIHKISTFIIFVIMLLVSGCDKSNRLSQTDSSIKSYEYDESRIEKVNVGLMLPLSGRFKDIGQKMLDAAVLCIYEYAGPNINLIIEDTKGSPDGSSKAFANLKQKNVEIILGPVFASNVKVIKKIRGNIPFIVFSSDVRLKEPGLFVFGHDVNEQVDAVFNHIRDNMDINNTLLILPDDEYGRLINSYIKQNQIDYRVNVIQTVFMEKDLSKTGKKVKEIIDKNKENGTDVDSIFIPLGGIKLKLIVDAMTYAGVDIKGIGIKTKEEEREEKIEKRRKRKELEKLMKENPDFVPIQENGEPFEDLMKETLENDRETIDINENPEQENKPIVLVGTSQWMQKQTLGNHFIEGGIFAGPKAIDSTLSNQFKRNFKKEMGVLDALCFDAVYVCAIIANKYGKIKEEYLTAQDGFDLSQGEFSFLPNGDTKRKLNIYRVSKKGFDIIN